MQVVVTGAAGFVGSAVVRALVDQGHRVHGIDCLLAESYSAEVKGRRAAEVRDLPGVTWSSADLRAAELAGELQGADAVIHEAAMPGLMRSWSDFEVYSSCNLDATERLLRAARDAGIGRFVQISTSSVYGRDAVGAEDSPLRPYSPYGVTKLAAENLVQAYADNFGLNAVILRYFSIYGPGQRPDMGYHLFTEALLDDDEITVFGDGTQIRSNTYVDDAVAATVGALAGMGDASGGHGQGRDLDGAVMNVAGGEAISVLEAIAILGDELGVTPRIRHAAPRPGDQAHTRGDASRARALLGWTPSVGIEDGLRRQARWQRDSRDAGVTGAPAGAIR